MRAQTPILILAAFLSAAAAPAFAVEIQPDTEAAETGRATYYAKRFEGRRTASGATFRHAEMVAAHGSHPFGTIVRVTNLDRGRSVDVRIADRGGFSHGRGSVIIDLSQAAAARLGMIARGHARVLVEVIEWGGKKVGFKGRDRSTAAEPDTRD